MRTQLCKGEILAAANEDYVTIQQDCQMSLAAFLNGVRLHSKTSPVRSRTTHFTSSVRQVGVKPSCSKSRSLHKTRFIFSF